LSIVEQLFCRGAPNQQRQRHSLMQKPAAACGGLFLFFDAVRFDGNAAV
jgi:hypothetical protein